MLDVSRRYGEFGPAGATLGSIEQNLFHENSRRQAEIQPHMVI
jgi:hypothetical protein